MRIMLKGISFTTEGWIIYNTTTFLEEIRRVKQWRKKQTDISFCAFKILEACVRTIVPPS